MTTPFHELMAGLTPRDGRFAGVIPADWLQGRTTFGGLAAALCLESALRAFPGQPPLRSAQVVFIGPAGGDFDVEATMLRAGRAVTFIGADLRCENRLATHAVFAFGVPRVSAFEHDFVVPPDVPPPGDCGPYFNETFAPGFVQHFDVRLAHGARPVSGATAHEHHAWVRHRDERAISPVALLALADVPPPAVVPMLANAAPISSMTWIANFLSGAPSTRDGWWLLRFCADGVAQGYSSQDMTVWNSDGEPVIAGRQSIAVFT